MNTLLVLAAISGIVAADVGLGYHYKVPHTSSYGVPSYTVGSSGSSNYNTAFTGAAANHFKNPAGYQDAHVNTQNQAAYSTFQSSGSGVGNQYYTTGAGSASAGVIGNTLAQPNHQYSGSSGENSFQLFNNYQHANNYQQKYQYQFQKQQPAQIFKHFYVHAAPEEPEVKVQPKTVVLPAPQKHYKIIFIKTPIQPVAPPQLIPIQPQSEEKTIVYVLVNKPQEPQDVVVPKAEVKPPSKPEVYFIKYNTKEGSQAVINNIVNDYNKEQSAEHFGSSGAVVDSYTAPQAVASGSSSSGSYSEKAPVATGPIASSQSESALLASLTAPFGKAPGGHAESHSHHSSSNYDTAFVSGSDRGSSLPSYPSKETVSSGAGYDNSASGSSSSSASVTGSGSAQTYQNVSPISTSQGVPHESYGVPKFKVA